ncbi:hypothetical protein BSL78_08471 [Apostichopus japonicus]|uniref:Fibronectin type-III domain-containing protein n=1 Tax=Stichopus japonicus TaxID=307972 RepID=A0A2G8L2Y8_STIJA|nr:hypothetical protein BSL78_08471 [Apostichopus japonicus]
MAVERGRSKSRGSKRNGEGGKRPGFLDYKVPVVYNPEKPMEYNTTIYDLRANATYYVELFAYNRYGQGDIETFEFTTAAVDEPNSVSEPPPTKPLPRSYGGSGRLLQASMYTSLACFSFTYCY